MAESESGQEKTEMPTPKKLQELMESGQFARSQEVQTLVLLLAALLILTVMAPKMVETFRVYICLLYTSPSPRDATLSRMPSSA